MGFRYPYEEELPLWGESRAPASDMPLSEPYGKMFGPENSVANYEEINQPSYPVNVQPRMPNLPSSPRGSGIVRSQIQFGNQQAGQGYNYGRYPTPDEFKNMTQIVRESPEIQSMLRNQEMNKNIFQQHLKAPSLVDFATPLANLSDYNQTGRLGNRQPISHDNAKLIREYAKQIQDDEKDIANSIFSGVQRTKLGTETGQNLDQIRTTETQTVYPPEKFEKATSRAKEPKAISSAQIERLAHTQQVPALLDDMERLINENADKFGPIEGTLRSYNPYDETAQTLRAAGINLMQTIGRTKEGGVLRQEDERKYTKMLPNLSDLPKVAREKLKLLRRDIFADQNNIRNSLERGGYNVKSLAPIRQVPNLSTTISSGSPDFFKPQPANDIQSRAKAELERRRNQKKGQ